MIKLDDRQTIETEARLALRFSADLLREGAELLKDLGRFDTAEEYLRQAKRDEEIAAAR